MAVEGQLGPILIGILLRRGEATDLTFRERRERIEGEGLIAIVHRAHQILAEKVGIGVLEADQMAFGAGDTVGIEPSVVYALPPLVTADMFFPSHRP